MRAFDWAASPLGPTESWPHSLSSVLSLTLNTNFPIAIYWGPELLLLYNDAWSPIPGTKHPWALGRPAREAWSEIWDIIGPLFDQVITTGAATRRKDQLLPMRRHGYTEECYFDYTFSPIRDEAGVVAGVFNAVVETTGRVVGERRLKTLRDLGAQAVQARSAEEAARLAITTIGENTADIPFALLYLVTPDEGEATLCEVAGLRSGANGAPRIIRLHGASDDPSLWPLQEVVRSGDSVLVTDLGSRFGELPGGPWPEHPAEAIILPLREASQGKNVGFLVCGVSPYRALDEDYRSFFDLVASHTATAIANARAFQEEKRRAEALAELDRAKTAFFSNVSHEFRTPLTLMLGPIEDALTAPLAPAQRERLELVHRNALRLQKLVNSLLDFSRIESGRLKASYMPTDLSSFTAELASVFRSAIERAGMQLKIECGPLSKPAYIDPEMWEKIVLNLISNAFKFTLEGEISVTLGQSGEQAVLRVRDTGGGIAEDQLPHIFERFHRVEGARARTHEGTGIGLALVQELVRLHGGTVEVESTVGEGTTFTVRVPLGSEHFQSGQVDTARKAASDPGASRYVAEALRWLPQEEHRHEPDQSLVIPDAEAWTDIAPAASIEPRHRILIADDNADLREYLSRLLAARYTVEAVGDGEAAFAAAKASQPDLVLTDVMMPKLDGFGLLSALRADSGTRTIPVILLSARAGEEARVEGLGAGADDYLVKPFSARELLARVDGTIALAKLRRDAEQALKDRESVLAGILGSITDAFFVLDNDWRFSFVNDEFVRRFAMPREDLLGMHIWDLVPAAKGSAADTQLTRAMEERVTVEYEVFYEPWQRWYRDKAYPTDDGGLAIYSQDVTSAKEAEAALRDSEERFRQMADSAPVMVWITSPDGACTFLSKTWYSFTGQTPDSALGLGWMDAVHPDDRKATGDRFLLANAHREAFELEYRLRRHDGEYRWAIDAAAPRFGPAGQFLGYIGSVFDITDRKRIEAERERLLREARSAKEDAEAANRMKDEFLATLSHELRTPLNAILGWAHLLRSNKTTMEDMREGIEVIERNSRAQAQLIEDLLDISRIISGKMTLDVQRIQVQEVIDTAISAVLPAAAARGITVEKRLDLSADPVAGDATRIQQIVWNLLSNAVKFTPRGGKVEVALKQLGAYVEISVSDTGIGINPEFLPYVFERFRQADGTTTRRHGGLGLGLAIVKQLVEMHGGGVRAHSEGEGRGATFAVTLPVSGMRAEIHSARTPEEERLVSLDGLLARVRVLVVDDEADARQLIRRILVDCHADVAVAGSADEALELLSRSSPDVLLSDIGMPGKDGYELIREVRRRLTTKELPAAALTAFARSEDRREAMMAGFQTHIAKPVEPQELIAVVASLAGRTGKG